MYPFRPRAQIGFATGTPRSIDGRARVRRGPPPNIVQHRLSTGSVLGGLGFGGGVVVVSGADGVTTVTSVTFVSSVPPGGCRVRSRAMPVPSTTRTAAARMSRSRRRMRGRLLRADLKCAYVPGGATGRLYNRLGGQTPCPRRARRGVARGDVCRIRRHREAQAHPEP